MERSLPCTKQLKLALTKNTVHTISVADDDARKVAAEYIHFRAVQNPAAAGTKVDWAFNGRSPSSDTGMFVFPGEPDRDEYIRFTQMKIITNGDNVTFYAELRSSGNINGSSIV